MQSNDYIPPRTQHEQGGEGGLACSCMWAPVSRNRVHAVELLLAWSKWPVAVAGRLPLAPDAISGFVL
jgi:hypothetical protein